MNDELVSVLMPIRDPDISQLKTSLMSVKNQTYPHIECVIVFDRHHESRDEEALSVIDTMGIENLRLVKREIANGFTNALNDGIGKSSGKYIARLDSDDVAHPERIKKQIEYMERTKCSLIGSWAKIIDENDNILKLFQAPYDSQDIRRNIMKHDTFVHSSIMFNKDDIKRAGSYDPLFDGAEDYELFLRLVGKGFKVANIPEFLVDIRESQNSILRAGTWRKNRKAYVRSKFRAMTKYGFHRPSDIFHCAISPISLFLDANRANSFKSLTGWYVTPNNDGIQHKPPNP